MKLIKMTLNTILLFSILTIFTSCNGQNASQVNNINDHDSFIAKGDTVKELSNSLWIIFQDKNNNYWFGSDGQGVYRYDGKTILHFSTKDGLPNNRIRGIQEDKSGNIYITTLEGISKFDGQTFTTLTPIETNEWTLDPNALWFSIPGKTGEYGPYRYDGKSLYHLKFPKHYLEDEYYSGNSNPPSSPYEVYTIYKDSKGNIWFGTAALGVCRYDGKTLSWMYEKELTETPEGGSFGIRSIIEDKEGKFWFCNTQYRYNIYPDITPGNNGGEKGNGLINYKREKGIDLLETQNGGDFIYYQFIAEDNQQDLWMSTYRSGVWQYDGVNMTHYPVRDGAEDIKIISIYKDNHGDLWLGTQEAGAYKFNGKTFEKFRPELN